MKNFKQGNGKFGKKNFGKSDFRGRSQMHDATCSNCGKKCQVPFRPTDERPVFCSDCFDKERGSAGERNFGRKDQGRSHFEKKRMYQAVCSKCGNKCEIPFLPTGGRAVYCSNCFDSGISTTDRRHDEPRRDHKFADRKNSGLNYSNQFESINTKLDKLIILLTPAAPAQVIASSKTAKATKPKKAAKKSAKKAAAPRKTKRK